MTSKTAALVTLVMLCLAVTAGCTDSSVLDTGVYRVDFVLGSTGAAGLDCAVMNFSSLTVRPLDGVCAGGSNAGSPCGGLNDCPGGTCEGALAGELVPQSIGVAAGLQRTSITGSPCEVPSLAGGGTSLPSVLLSGGLYTIATFNAGQPVLVTGASQVSCGGAPDLTAAFKANAPQDLLFTVGPSSTNAVVITIDIDALQGVVGFPPPSCDQLAANAHTILSID